MKLAMPPDYLADARKRAAEHDSAMNANKISLGLILFWPLVIIAGAMAAVLPLVGAVLSILGTWAIIVLVILFFIMLWRQ